MDRVLPRGGELSVGHDVGPHIGRLQRDLDVAGTVIEVLDDLLERLRRLSVGHGRPHDLAACLFQLVDLAQRRLDVPRVGLGHRLHSNRRRASDDDAADIDRDRLAARDHRYQRSSPGNWPIAIRWMSRKLINAARPSSATSPMRWKLSSLARSNGLRRSTSMSTTTTRPPSRARNGSRLVKPSATESRATKKT